MGSSLSGRILDEGIGARSSFVDLETRVPCDHPLRAIRAVADESLAEVEGELAALHSAVWRPSISPAKLLRSVLLQVFYSIESERQLMERLEFDLLFRWFIGIATDDTVGDHSTFCHNRAELLDGGVAEKFLRAVLSQPRVKRLLSSEHFNVDRALIEALGSNKAIKSTDSQDERSSGNAHMEVNFRGEILGSGTHPSTADPDGWVYRHGSGMEAELCFIHRSVTENRSGLIEIPLITANDHADGVAALPMTEPRGDWLPAIRVGTHHGYNDGDFVNEAAGAFASRAEPQAEARVLTRLPDERHDAQVDEGADNSAYLGDGFAQSRCLEIGTVHPDERPAPGIRQEARGLKVGLAVGALILTLGVGWAVAGSPFRVLKLFINETAVGAMVDRIIYAESSGCAYAKNERSSATGIAQFLDETWLELIRAYRPELARLSKNEVLELRRDPQLAHEMTTRFAERNSSFLRARRLPVTSGTIYLSHFAGPAGAVAILTAPDDVDAAAVMARADRRGRTSREEIVSANPFLQQFTVADLKRWADRKMQMSGTLPAVHRQC